MPPRKPKAPPKPPATPQEPANTQPAAPPQHPEFMRLMANLASASRRAYDENEARQMMAINQNYMAAVKAQLDELAALKAAKN